MTKTLLNYLPVMAGLFIAACTQAQSPKPKAVFNHNAIYVASLKASGAFYQNILGLDTIPEPFHDGKHLWLKIGPAMSLHIIEGSPAKKEYYKSQHTCFSVASVEAFAELLRKNNMKWEDYNGAVNVITTRVDGVKQLWLQDPDGYWVEVNDAKQ